MTAISTTISEDQLDEDFAGTSTTSATAAPSAPIADVAAERDRLLTYMVASFRMFARLGFDEGVAGHITVRDPERRDHFWVNPYGVHFSRLKRSDLLLLDATGHVVNGSRRTNKVAFAIHSGVHRARADVGSVVHAHSLYGRTWASLGRPLDPIIQESCAFYDDHVIFNQYGGMFLDRSEGDHIAEALGSKRAAILRNHGFLTVGRSVEDAVWWFITMDRAAQMQLMAEAAGTPIMLNDDEARIAHRQFGGVNLARHSFQLFADIVIEEEPDLLQ